MVKRFPMYQHMLDEVIKLNQKNLVREQRDNVKQELGFAVFTIGVFVAGIIAGIYLPF